jgi:phosphoglycerate dehydrogenase-like enzyme
MSNRILITPRSLSSGGHPGLMPLTEAGYELVFAAVGSMPTEADLLAAIPGCVGWLAGVEPVSTQVIAAADKLRVISRNGTGIDNLPVEILAAKNIAVCRAEGTNARGVAELALALSLTAMRRIVPTHQALVNGKWSRWIGREMQGARVAVIGLGAIGAQFAGFALGLGADVNGFDPFAAPDRVLHDRFARTSLVDAIRDANLVSLHAPLPVDGRPLLGSALLATLAPGAVVVNTARAGLVDADAMLAALASDQVGCYATDVFETEPPEPSPVLLHPHVLLTSHIGGYTVESVDRTTRAAVENMLEVLTRHAT